MGLFGGGNSTSTTNNQDKRLVTGEGSIGVSADNSTVVTNITDGGIVSRALDSIDMAGATNADGFARLLDSANLLFDRGESLIGQTQAAVADAYGQAQADKTGGIDQRTLIVLAVVAGVALFAFRGK